MNWMIKAAVLAITFYVFSQLIRLYRDSSGSILQTANKARLLFTGFVANVADTLGIGSFAVIVAFDKSWKLVDDKKLPGTLNGHSVLPALVQSLLFLKFVEIDMVLLSLFVLAGCIGGFIGGFIVSRLDRQKIRLAMSIGFLGIALLILANQLNFYPVAGEAVSLAPLPLMFGCLAMLLVGMLPSIGVGCYAPTQVVLFLLGLSPIIAFPIMSTVGVIIQSSSAIAFIARKEIAIKETILLSFSGVIAAVVSVPLVAYANFSLLRWLLLGIVCYNAYLMYQSYLKTEKERLNLIRI